MRLRPAFLADDPPPLELRRDIQRYRVQPALQGEAAGPELQLRAAGDERPAPATIEIGLDVLTTKESGGLLPKAL